MPLVVKNYVIPHIISALLLKKTLGAKKRRQQREVLYFMRFSEQLSSIVWSKISQTMKASFSYFHVS